jgi:MFS family permease
MVGICQCVADLSVLGVCSFYILLTPVADTIGIVFEQQTWIVVSSRWQSRSLQTSFGVTFASFLLFWGRFVDLYSPKPVFSGAFFAFGILNLVISFTVDKYSYLILRGLTGITAAALIPASYRLITSIFTKDELPVAFTAYALSGSIAGSCGVTFGGLVTLIPGGGQMLGWRWFFRITAGIV